MIAVLLELGRTLPADPGRHPLVLVAFSTEEPPFFLSKDMGSYRFADAWKARGEKLDLMVALDLVGCFTDEPASQGFPVPGMGFLYPRTGNFIAVVGDLRSGRSIRSVKRGMLAARALPVESFRAPGLVPGVLWSDPLSFRRKGCPAVLVTETAFLRYEHYHAPSDTAEKLDYNRMAAVVRCLHGIVREADGGQMVFESGDSSYEPQYMPGWEYNYQTRMYDYEGPRYASVIPEWQLKGEPAQWIIEDGKMRQKWDLTNKDLSTLGDSKIEAKNVLFRGGVITFRTMIGEAQHSRAGMEFRCVTDQDYYRIVVEEKSGVEGWAAKLQKCVAGIVTTLAEQDVDVNANQWIDFRVYASGGTFKIRINDKPVLDYNDLDTVMEQGAVRLIT